MCNHYFVNKTKITAAVEQGEGGEVCYVKMFL